MSGLFNWEFDVSEGPDAARASMREVLGSHGFTIDEEGPDRWHVQHGEAPSFFRQLVANVDFPTVLTVTFAPTAGGTQITMKRPLLSHASSNPTELAHLDRDYRAFGEAVQEHLSATGTLVSARA